MDEFMFRDQEIRRIQIALQRRESILLEGIRRTGKSQLMKEIVRRHNAASPVKVFYLDVQAHSRLHDFYSDLLVRMPRTLLQRAYERLQAAKSIPDFVMNWLRRHIDSVEVDVSDSGIKVKLDLNEHDDQDKYKAVIVRYWEPIAKALLKLLENPGVRDEISFFALDEFPLMLKNLLTDPKVPVSPEELSIALATLRKFRDSIPMILSGSISLRNLLRLHNISFAVFSDLQPQNLPPFSRPEARRYLQARFAGHPAAAGIDVILDRLPDYIPEFLNQSASLLSAERDMHNVDMIMDDKVLPAIRRSFDWQIQDRLDRNYPDNEQSCAEQLLEQLAKAPKSGGPIDISGLSSADRRVLQKLEDDMFIEKTSANGFRFTLNAFRLCCRNRCGMTE